MLICAGPRVCGGLASRPALASGRRVSCPSRADGTLVEPSGSSPTVAPLGDVAQLAEHCLCKAGVVGSSPIVSTNPEDWRLVVSRPATPTVLQGDHVGKLGRGQPNRTGQHLLATTQAHLPEQPIGGGFRANPGSNETLTTECCSLCHRSPLSNGSGSGPSAILAAAALPGQRAVPRPRPPALGFHCWRASHTPLPARPPRCIR